MILVQVNYLGDIFLFPPLFDLVKWSEHNIFIDVTLLNLESSHHNLFIYFYMKKNIQNYMP